MTQDYDTIVRECKRSRTLFEDPEFPATSENIFYSRKPPKPFQWKRPKEIVSDPKWIVGGASRFDIKQGMLGDCWLLSAISSLACHSGLLERVIFHQQNFENDYCGVFKFNLWREGKWVEVVVDDRLPTHNGRLVFMHSQSNNEFWSSLLEKAFAKLAGSYEACKGGQTSEAMCDLTGGVTEIFDLQKPPGDLFKCMLKAHNRNSLMGCSIEVAANEIESKGPNGLVKGHAYSVTKVLKVPIRTRMGESDVELVRVRNSWGNEREWTGAWSDTSREWSAVSEDEKKKLGLVWEDDGEFWMSYKDFISNFTRLEMCNLGPDSISGNRSKSWESFQEDGEWVHGFSAGGCRNFINSFASNPQFRMTLTDPDEDEDVDNCTVVISVLQKGRRKLKEKGKGFLTIGFAIYEVEDAKNTAPLDKEFFMYHASSARSPQFINSREICARFSLAPGTYAVVPSTFDPNQTGKFLIRIFSEKAHETRQLDEETQFIDPKDGAVHRRPLTEQEKELDSRFYRMFEKLAGADKTIDAFEVAQILSKAFKEETGGQEFEIEHCRSIVALFDTSRSGTLEYKEFEELWIEIRKWMHQFKSYDKDNSGSMSLYELRSLLAKLGFKLSNGTLSLVIARFRNRKGTVSFQDVLLCIARMTSMLKNFDIKNNGYKGQGLDEFFMNFMYT